MPFNKIPGPTVGADLSCPSPIYRPSGKSITSPHQFVKQHYRAPGAAFNRRFFGADRHSRRGGRGVEWSGDACVAHGGQVGSGRGTGRRATQGSPPFFPARFTNYLPLKGEAGCGIQEFWSGNFEGIDKWHGKSYASASFLGGAQANTKYHWPRQPP